MKQFFDMCSLLNKRSFWVVSLLLLMGQTARAYAPDNSPDRRAPKVLGLGNRVFLDYNRDGIQNDSDPGVSGLTVRLYRQGILRGTTTTGSTGDYAFVNANVSEGLLPDTDYEIRIAVTDISSRTLVLSKKDQGGDDNLDSDAQIAGSVAVIYARTNTAALDTPNDSYDFGLSAEDPDLNIVKSASQSQVVLGSNASFTIRVDNNSTGTATNVVVKDTLGAGMAYVSSSPAATVTTAGSLTILTWNVGTILGGANSVLNLTVNTKQEGVLYNTAYVTTTDAEPATKNNVSRACVTVPIKLCPGDEYVASLPAGYTSVQWYRNGTLVSSASSLTITSAGSYSFTADYTTCPANGCCPIIVEDGILPALAITPANPAICAGASTVLSLTGCGTGSILWSTGESTASITVSPTSTATGVYSVTCNSTTYGTCTAFASTTVTVNPNPVVALSSATICSGEVASLTATAGFAQYQYSAGLTPVSGQPNVATGTTAGTYSVTAISAQGCSGTATGTITVNPLPVAVIAATSQTICNGTSVTLTASNSNNAVTGNVSYRWSNGETTASITVSPSSTTPYSVTITSAQGCTGTTSQTITVNPLPVAAIAASSLTICSGASSTLTASNTNTAVTSTLSYLWSTGATTASITVSPTNTTPYSVTITSAEGCTATSSQTITVNPTPVVALSSATICSGSVASLTATAGFAQYQFSAGLTPVSGQPNVATGSASGTYSVTALSTEGCSGTATGTITVNPLPVATIAASSLTVCDGTSVTLTAGNSNTAVTSSVSYLWSTGATTAQTVVTTSGVYSVTVTSAEGCSDTESTTITVNPKPVLTVSSPDLSIFAGESTTLTIGGCSGTLAWSTGDATASLIVEPLATTTYSVTCTLSTGCASSTSVTVTVTNAPSYTMPPMAIAATCSGANPNNDARIVLTTLQDVSKVGISLGDGPYSGPAFAGATDVVSGAVTFSGLPNPSAKQIYTLRLFSANGDYFVDVKTTLNPAECICPAPKCVPILISKVR